MHSEIISLLNDPEWDRPFFKRLANNDTGNSPGHQGGMVIPKELRKFFPSLDELSTSFEHPTTDQRFRAELYLETDQVGVVNTRYQMQTWSGLRSPETRITDNLSPIRNKAYGGDLIIFQRSLASFTYYRMVLVRQRHHFFEEINKLTSERGWGELFHDDLPLTQVEVAQERKKILGSVQSDFILIDKEKTLVETRQIRAARSQLFRTVVITEYEYKCAVSGIGLRSYDGKYEVNAAHVVPRSLGGADDPRNGLSLTSTLHWAFDQGLWSVKNDYCVVVPDCVLSIPSNGYLRQFNGIQISKATNPSMQISPEALQWHRQNVLKKID